ncbi:MAG: FtsW/RodA/SpoVE family cell cycle protein [Nitrospiraceae bacterium]|nr:FtsW/RodA/SpoVE family cell cycle protein [Nitrospiraceae bacterium]
MVAKILVYVVRVHPAFLVVLSALLLIDLLTLFSVTPYLAVKQGLWEVFGLLMGLGILLVPYPLFLKNARWIYGVVLALLAIVFLAGHASHGARRWIGLGWFQIQPSEFMILGLILFLTWLFVPEKRDIPLRPARFAAGLLASVFPALLIARQPDLGTAFELMIIFSVFVFLKGIPSRIVTISVLGGLAFFPVLWEGVWTHLHEFQKDRIRAFIDPSSDPSGLGYHTIQSIVAVGSGGWFGQGLSGATQVRYQFLPGAHTDFVFAVFTEEWGFAGALVFLALVSYLVWFGFRTAMDCRDPAGFYLSAGVTGFFLFCFLINVLMVLGILPVVGVPMPLMSYGGSAMIVSLGAMALLMNVRIYAKR